LWATVSFGYSPDQDPRRNLRNLRIIHLCVLRVFVVKFPLNYHAWGVGGETRFQLFDGCDGHSGDAFAASDKA
jgi:hypothetical protein